MYESEAPEREFDEAGEASSDEGNHIKLRKGKRLVQRLSTCPAQMELRHKDSAMTGDECLPHGSTAPDLLVEECAKANATSFEPDPKIFNVSRCPSRLLQVSKAESQISRRRQSRRLTLNLSEVAEMVATHAQEREKVAERILSLCDQDLDLQTPMASICPQYGQAQGSSPAGTECKPILQASGDGTQSCPMIFRRNRKSTGGCSEPHVHTTLSSEEADAKTQALEALPELVRRTEKKKIVRAKSPGRRRQRSLTATVRTTQHKLDHESIRLATAQRTAARGSSERSFASAATEAAESKAPHPLIIFDWDDTLFPTEWIRQNFQLDKPLSQNPVCEVLPESEHYAGLLGQGALIRTVLESAKALGTVAIVTLSVRPWVLTSARRFLPDLDMAALLQELNIEVYYAREHVHGVVARHLNLEAPLGIQPYTVAKRCAISSCVRRELRRTHQARWHVLSIGDGVAEQEASWEVCWDPFRARGEILCKTVKFVEEPTAQQLADELRVLLNMFPRLIAYEKDIDLNFADSVGCQACLEALGAEDDASESRANSRASSKAVERRAEPSCEAPVFRPGRSRDEPGEARGERRSLEMRRLLAAAFREVLGDGMCMCPRELTQLFETLGFQDAPRLLPQSGAIGADGMVRVDVFLTWLIDQATMVELSRKEPATVAALLTPATAHS